MGKFLRDNLGLSRGKAPAYRHLPCPADALVRMRKLWKMTPSAREHRARERK